MHVRMGLLKKHKDWTIDQFRTYWRENHSQLASQLPGLLKYEQNHVTDAQQRGISHKRGTDSVDGMSQLWFDDSNRMNDAFSKALGEKLIVDENHFIGHLRIVTAEPFEVIKPPKPNTTLKRMSFLKRRADVTPEVFAHEWKVVHAELVKKLPGVLGYRQNLITHRESPKGNVVDYDGLPIDGIVELWFESKDTLDAFSSPQGVEAMKHAETFIDEITTFLVDVHVVV